MPEHVIEDDHDVTGRGGLRPPEPSAQDEGKERLLGLSVPQLLGGAGAAVSSAVVASYLGVAGTLIGAALGSIVSTVSAALYTNWVRSAHDKLPTPRRVAVYDGSRGRRPSAGEELSGTGHQTGFGTATDQGPIVITAGRARRKRRLRRLVTGAVAVFALSITILTAIELGLGHPVSRQDQRGGTSIGTVVGTTDVTPGTVPDGPAPQAPSQSATQPAAEATSSPTDTASDGTGATSTSTATQGATTAPSGAATSVGGEGASVGGDGAPQPQASTPAG